MSENKDLEMIKECIHQIRWSDAEGEYDEVIEAASRMAAENKQYKEITERLAASGNNLGMALIELKTEIERLKAELAKRPEIIKCGECSFSYIANNSGVLKCPNSFYPIQVNDFCSAGVRRESEEKQ